MTARRRAPRRSKSEWQGILKQYETSGMTAAAYCRKAGLSLHTLRSWAKKLRRSSSARQAGFVEMRPTSVPLARVSEIGRLPFDRFGRRWTIDVIFPDGTTARMGG